MILFLALPISASTQMQNMTVISDSVADSIDHGTRWGSVVDSWHIVSLPDSLSSVSYATLSMDSTSLLYIHQHANISSASMTENLHTYAPKDFVFKEKLTKIRKNHHYGKNIDFWWNLTIFNKTARLELQSSRFCYYLAMNQWEISPLLQKIFDSYHHLHQTINNILNVNGTGTVSLTVLMMSLVMSQLVTLAIIAVHRTRYATTCLLYTSDAADE